MFDGVFNGLDLLLIIAILCLVYALIITEPSKVNYEEIMRIVKEKEGEE